MGYYDLNYDHSKYDGEHGKPIIQEGLLTLLVEPEVPNARIEYIIKYNNGEKQQPEEFQMELYRDAKDGYYFIVDLKSSSEYSNMNFNVYADGYNPYCFRRQRDIFEAVAKLATNICQTKNTSLEEEIYDNGNNNVRATIKYDATRKKFIVVPKLDRISNPVTVKINIKNLFSSGVCTSDKKYAEVYISSVRGKNANELYIVESPITTDNYSTSISVDADSMIKLEFSKTKTNSLFKFNNDSLGLLNNGYSANLYISPEGGTTVDIDFVESYFLYLRIFNKDSREINKYEFKRLKDTNKITITCPYRAFYTDYVINKSSPEEVDSINNLMILSSDYSEGIAKLPKGETIEIKTFNDSDSGMVAHTETITVDRDYEHYREKAYVIDTSESAVIEDFTRAHVYINVVNAKKYTIQLSGTETHSGKEVELSGSEMNHTFYDLAPGDYTCIVSCNGFDDQHSEFTMNGYDKSIVFRFETEELDTKEYDVSVECNVSNFDYVIEKDGVKVSSKSDPKKLPQGRYTLRVTSKGYRTYETSFVVNSDNVRLTVDMKEVFVSLSLIKESPSDIVVVVMKTDGTLVKDYSRLLPGDYVITATADGYDKFVKNITIVGNEVEVELRINLSQKRHYLDIIKESDTNIIVKDKITGLVVYDSEYGVQPGKKPEITDENREDYDNYIRLANRKL